MMAVRGRRQACAKTGSRPKKRRPIWLSGFFGSGRFRCSGGFLAVLERLACGEGESCYSVWGNVLASTPLLRGKHKSLHFPTNATPAGCSARRPPGQLTNGSCWPSSLHCLATPPPKCVSATAAARGCRSRIAQHPAACAPGQAIPATPLWIVVAWLEPVRGRTAGCRATDASCRPCWTFLSRAHRRQNCGCRGRQDEEGALTYLGCRIAKQGTGD